MQIQMHLMMIWKIGRELWSKLCAEAA